MKFAGLLVEAPTGRVLLLRRARSGCHPGTWESPGGRIEPTERAIDAALRELTEETGYMGDIRSLAAIQDRAGYRLFHGLVPREFQPALSFEHDAYSWNYPEHLPLGTHPMLASALR